MKGVTGLVDEWRWKLSCIRNKMINLLFGCLYLTMEFRELVFVLIIDAFQVVQILSSLPQGGLSSSIFEICKHLTPVKYYLPLKK